MALGPGRGDDGVDIRLWPEATRGEGEPATVLVQCKRERRKVAKATVKALWADVRGCGCAQRVDRHDILLLTWRPLNA